MPDNRDHDQSSVEPDQRLLDFGDRLVTGRADVPADDLERIMVHTQRLLRSGGQPGHRLPRARRATMWQQALEIHNATVNVPRSPVPPRTSTRSGWLHTVLSMVLVFALLAALIGLAWERGALEDETERMSMASTPPAHSPAISPPTPRPFDTSQGPLAATIEPFTGATVPYGSGRAFLLVEDIFVQWDYNANDLVARSATTDAVLWRVDGTVRGDLTSDGERLYAFMYDPNRERAGVFAFELQTGRERWFLEDINLGRFDPQYAGPILANGFLYILEETRTIYAIDTATGRVRWFSSLPEPGLVPLPEGTASVSLVTEGNEVVALTPGGTLVAYAGPTGEELWRMDLVTGKQQPFGGSLTSAQGTVFATVIATSTHGTPTAEGDLFEIVPTLHALVSATGEERWAIRTASLLSPWIVVGNRLVGLEVDAVASIDMTTGVQESTLLAAGLPSGVQSGYGEAFGDVAYVALSGGTGVTVMQIEGTHVTQEWRHAELAPGLSNTVADLVPWEGGLLILRSDGDPLFIPPAARTAGTPGA